MEWEEIFVNHISDKGLISKIYKKLPESCLVFITRKKSIKIFSPLTEDKIKRNHV